MSCRIWIHIGLHKTGSTALQRRLEASREFLLEAGLLYPETARYVPVATGKHDADAGHGLIARALRSGEPRHASRLFAELRREIAQSGARHVLISSEMLCAPPLEPRIGALKALTDDNDVRIVIYLRRPDLWVDSLYREHLTARARRERRDFALYLDEEADRLLDFERRIAVWAAAFGPDALRVRFYDDMRAAGTDPAEDILSLICPEAREKLAPPPAGPVNVSLARDHVDLMRALHAVDGLDRERRGAIIARLLASLPQGRPGTSLFSRPLWEAFAAQWREATERLADRFDAPPDSRFRLPDRAPERPLAESVPDLELAGAIIESLLAPGGETGKT